MAKVIIEGDSRMLSKIAKIFKRSVKVTNEDGTPFLVAAPAVPKKKKIKEKVEGEKKSKGTKMTTASVLSTEKTPDDNTNETKETTKNENV